MQSAILGTSVERAAQRIRRPYLIALLGLAIVLLGAASLPGSVVPGPRLSLLLIRHRFELAGFGAAVLAGVAVALLR